MWKQRLVRCLLWVSVLPTAFSPHPPCSAWSCFRQWKEWDDLNNSVSCFGGGSNLSLHKHQASCRFSVTAGNMFCEHAAEFPAFIWVALSRAMLVPTWNPCLPLHHVVSSFGGISITDTMSPTCKRWATSIRACEESTIQITAFFSTAKTLTLVSNCTNANLETSAFVKSNWEAEELLHYTKYRIQLFWRKQFSKAQALCQRVQRRSD